MPRYPLLPNCTFRETFESISSVSQNKGTIVGGSVTPGKFTGNGTTSNYVSYPKGTQIFGTKWSVRVKFKASAWDATFSTLVAKDVASNRAFVLGISSTGVPYYECYPSGGGSPTGQSALSLNTVYDIVYTSDGTNTRTFVNGVQNGSTGSSTNVPFVSGNLTIGRRDYSGNERSLNGEIYLVEFYQGIALDAETCLGLYQQDTITELDASKALVYLPLKSWYYKENGTQLLTDGDMEAVGVTAWTAFNCNLTKETGTRTGGTGTKVLRLTSTGVSAAAYQSASVTVGKTYRITGWARSVDGVGQPYLDWVGGAASWIGTVSTSWQYFDCMLPAEPSGGVALRNFGGAGSAVEYDDVKTELCIAQTKNIGSLGGYALLGDGSTTTTFPTQKTPHGMSFDGGDYLKVDAGIGPLLTLSMPFTFSVLMYDDKGLSDTTGYSIGGTWDTAQSKGILFYKYPSASYGPGVRIGSSSGNFIEARGNEAPPGTHLYTFTYNGSGTFEGLRIYIDGKLSSWINGSTGTLGADIVSGKGVILGARWNGAASPHQFLTSGKRILDVSIYPVALTPVQVKGLYESLKKTLNV